MLHSNRSGHCLGFNYERYWSRSLLTALAAQALSPYAKINDEDNFTAGLLCKIGELAHANRLGINHEDFYLIADSIITNRLEWGELLKIQTHKIPSFADLLASSESSN